MTDFTADRFAFQLIFFMRLANFACLLDAWYRPRIRPMRCDLFISSLFGHFRLFPACDSPCHWCTTCPTHVRNVNSWIWLLFSRAVWANVAGTHRWTLFMNSEDSAFGEPLWTLTSFHRAIHKTSTGRSQSVRVLRRPTLSPKTVRTFLTTFLTLMIFFSIKLFSLLRPSIFYAFDLALFIRSRSFSLFNHFWFISINIQIFRLHFDFLMHRLAAVFRPSFWRSRCPRFAWWFASTVIYSFYMHIVFYLPFGLPLEL